MVNGRDNAHTVSTVSKRKAAPMLGRLFVSILMDETLFSDSNLVQRNAFGILYADEVKT